MIPITTLGSGADVASRLVGEIVNQSFEDLANDVSYKLWGFNDYELDSPDEQITGISAPSGSRVTIEGAAYGVGDRYRDYAVSPTLEKHTIELSVTEELEHWNKKKSMFNTLRGLKNWADEGALSLNHDVDLSAASILYNGFGTTVFTGGDGLSIFNSSHLIRAGGTQSNMFNTTDTHLPFTQEALDKAISIMNRYKAPNGRQLRPCRRLRVLCSTENASLVARTLYSQYGVDSAHLGLNKVGPEVAARRGFTIDYAIVDKMPVAYKDYWFVVDLERAQIRNYMGFGWKPRVNFDKDLSKGIPTAALGSVYYGPFVVGFQSIFGSKGDVSSTA